MIHVQLSYLDGRPDTVVAIRHADRIVTEQEAARRGWDPRTQPQSYLALQAHKAARRDLDSTPENFDDFINELDNLVPILDDATRPTPGAAEPAPA
jgi:hypothetical protein